MWRDTNLIAKPLVLEKKWPYMPNPITCDEPIVMTRESPTYWHSFFEVVQPTIMYCWCDGLGLLWVSRPRFAWPTDWISQDVLNIMPMPKPQTLSTIMMLTRVWKAHVHSLQCIAQKPLVVDSQILSQCDIEYSLQANKLKHKSSFTTILARRTFRPAARDAWCTQMGFLIFDICWDTFHQTLLQPVSPSNTHHLSRLSQQSAIGWNY